GIFIVLGSSLKLVISAWSEAGDLLRMGFFSAYTVAFFGVARLTDRRLLLARTGVALHALSLFLIAVLGLAAQRLGLLHSAGGALMTAGLAAGSAFMARESLETL